MYAQTVSDAVGLSWWKNVRLNGRWWMFVKVESYQFRPKTVGG